MDWQHPFVDVFKQFGVFEIASSQAKGQVNVIQDNLIGRKIVRLQGAISSNNSVSIPSPLQGTKSLNLSGRYIYIEFIPISGRYFTLHFDIQIKDREPLIKLTVSNMYDQHKVQSQQLHIPYPKHAPNKWTILILDLEYFLSNFGLLPTSLYKSFKGIHFLKSFQICSSMNIRGIYTSDNLYDWESMPKQMLFKLPTGAKYSDLYQIAYWPTLDIQPQISKEPLKEIASGLLENLQMIEDNKEKYKTDTQKTFKSTIQQQSAPQVEELVKKRDTVQAQSKSVDAVDHPLQPYPIQTLSKIIGFTVRTCPDIKWGRQSENQKNITYAGGNLLIQLNVKDNSQKFFFGHSKSISCLDVSKDGEWIVSGQGGKNGVIRIWKNNGDSLSAFATPYNDLVNISFSSDRKLLVTTGYDDHNREILIIWGLENVETTRKPILYAKQTSSVNVLCIRFSPIDNNKIISCGNENIRFWRIKDGHLPGASVILNHHARNTTFGIFDFEYNYEDQNVANVYFGSKNGFLFQVNYNKQQLIQVFKVHNEAITAVCVSAGFCVTGSLDQFLRVWPLDFSEFYIEAKHEGVITSLDMSLDGLQVACGTSTGSLGILDISSHHYKTVIRSHTGDIRQIQIHSYSNLLLSLSDDCTIRLWDLEKSDQVYEFTFPSDDKCTVICGSPIGMYFTAGFKSGIHRIFDIDNTSIIFEGKYHDAEIATIAYHPQGNQLIIGDIKNTYKIYDILRDCQPIKTIQSSIPSSTYASYSIDGALISLIEGGNNIELWDTNSLQSILKLTTKYKVQQLKWAANNIELVCGMQDSRIVVYGIERANEMITAYYLREQTYMHKTKLNDFALFPNMKYILSVGAEPFVKVWDYEFSIKGPGSSQVFIGHCNNVSSIDVCDNGNCVITAGGEEGIFIWKFHGYTGKNERYLKMDNMLETKQIEKVEELPQQQQELLDDYEEVFEKEIDKVQNQLVDIYSQTRPKEQEELEQQQQQQQQQSSQDTQDIQQNIEFKPFRLQQENPFQFDYERIIVTKSHSSRKKLEKPIQYIQSALRYQNNLPYRQYIIDRKNPIEESTIVSDNILGYNNEGHDNVIWCKSQNWYAYTSQNNINVIQQTRRETKHFTISFKGIISVMYLDKSEMNLIIGMAHKIGECAPIYIYSTESFKQTHVLNFHTCGVHEILLTNDNKYMISIGNGKECTVVVWDYQTKKFITSSYTLERINHARISKYAFSKERVIEFATVGRDQVHFWALTQDNKLEYYDYFIPKNQNNQLEEITSFDYVYYSAQSKQVPIQQDQIIQLVLLGLQSGEIVLLKYGEFKILFRRFITHCEITNIVVNQAINRIFINTVDSSILIMDTKKCTNLNTFLDSGFAFQKINLPSLVCSMVFDQNSQHALLGLQNAGIYQLDLQSQQLDCLHSSNGDYTYNVQEPTTTKNIMPFMCTQIQFCKLIEDKYLVNVHQEGIVRIWDFTSFQLLSEHNWQSNITTVMYDAQAKQIIFFQEFGQLKIIHIPKLDIIDQFKLCSDVGSDTIVSSIFGMFDSIPGRFVLDQSGVLYHFDSIYKNQEYVLRFTKSLELLNICSIAEQSDKKVIFAIESNTGIVNTLQVDYNVSREFQFGFTMLDQANFLANPHGNLDNAQTKEDTRLLYSNIDVQTSIISGKGLDNVYFAILDQLQYVYGRNYQKRQIILLITLNDLPKQIGLITDMCRIVVLTQKGYIEAINVNASQNRAMHTPQIENAKHLLITRKKSVLFLANDSLMNLYNKI